VGSNKIESQWPFWTSSPNIHIPREALNTQTLTCDLTTPIEYSLQKGYLKLQRYLTPLKGLTEFPHSGMVEGPTYITDSNVQFLITPFGRMLAHVFEGRSDFECFAVALETVETQTA
jgi:hypothetical protein